MSSRLTNAVVDGVDSVYAAAETWVERALRDDDSLFTPGTSIWRLNGLQRLRERFLDGPIEGSDDFFAKLRSQLEGSPPEIYQLMAEVLFAHFLIIRERQIKGATKCSQIDEVLSWGAPISVVPDAVAKGLTPGISGNRALNLYRPEQVGLIIEFAEQWKETSPGEQERRLDDPWAFKEFVDRITPRSQLVRESPGKARAQQLAVLHLVHPDTFERMLTDEDRKRFVDKYAHLLTEETTDTDRQLQQIRSALEDEHGEDFDFYQVSGRRR